MKNFVDFLNESKKTYPFKIGVAGELPENFADMLETALSKYGVLKLTSGKKTPIQERPLDFPQLQNLEVTYFETELNYPTTVQVLQEYVGQCCGINQSHIIVRNPNEPQELYQEPKSEEAYEVKITKEELEAVSAQESVGGNRVMDLLKELEKVRKENENSPIQATPVGKSADINTKENNTSPVGSK